MIFRILRSKSNERRKITVSFLLEFSIFKWNDQLRRSKTQDLKRDKLSHKVKTKRGFSNMFPSSFLQKL